MDELEQMKQTVASLEAKVAELEAKNVTLEGEVAKSEKDNAQYLKDNFKLREKLRSTNTEELTSEVERLTKELEEAQDYKVKFSELETALNKSTRDSKLTPILSKLGITDPKAVSIALTKFDGIEDETLFEEEAKKVASEYSFLVTDKKFIPNTGKSKQTTDDGKSSADNVSDYFRDKFK